MSDNELSLMDLARLEGLHVGLLTPEELRAFNKACERKQAWRDYGDLAGFLGMPKVRIVCLS